MRRPGLRLLLGGQAISALGDWMATIALMALVDELTGSSIAVGGMLVLRLAPAGVAGPLAARAVRHWDRRRTMLAMDVIRVVIVVLIPIVRQVWWVYLWAFFLEVASLVFLPARDASIPDLAERDDLPLANGLILASSYGTIPLGAACFAAVAALIDHMGAVFWIDGVTFAVSFLMISRIEGIGGSRAAASVAGSEPGFRHAFRIPLVRLVGPLALVVALGLGSLFSSGIKFVRDVLSASDLAFGLLVALFGVGAAVGVAVVQATRLRGVTGLRAAVVVQGAVVAVMSLSPTIGFAFLGAVGFGAATAAALTVAMAVLQDRLADAERVLAFTAFHVIIRGGLAVAALGAGAATDLLRDVEWPAFGRLEPVRVVLLCSGSVVALCALSSRWAARTEQFR